ncbi:MAG: rRNA pseudouridine synthase [Holosporales bacterium]|nr:rRNA pseudouridine synthase [Holosporales bacterium]
MSKKIRLNKALSALGICSRREADRLISYRQISVNGKLVVETWCKISPTDTISINEKKYTIGDRGFNPRVWIYYKPRGLITTRHDKEGRKTVFEDVDVKIGMRVISVGRLDFNSEGLLLMTNDGAFAQYAMLPKTAWERRYKVRVFGEVTEEMRSMLKKGMCIEGVKYAPLIVTTINRGNGKNCWLNCILKEGKNREIRKLFGYFGISVNKLIRYQYGPYSLGNLMPGEVKEADVHFEM